MGSGRVRFRIFVSSPGDVTEERELARRVIDRLNAEFSGRAEVEGVFWEDLPLRATAEFQVQILSPALCEAMVCVLWSRLGTRLSSNFVRPDGTPYASGTEWEFEEAIHGNREHGTPALLTYIKTADRAISVSGGEDSIQAIEQKRALDGFVQTWFGKRADGSLGGAHHQFEDGAQFEGLLEKHLRSLIERVAPEFEASESLKLRSRIWKHGSPFRGLSHFDFEHEEIFFGRTRAIGEVLDGLRAQAQSGCTFLLVLGMSGAGKSSLVRAGVLPLLTRPGVIEGVHAWRRAVCRPSSHRDDPLRALAEALLAETALPAIGADGTDAEEFAQLLADRPDAAAGMVRGALVAAAADLPRKKNDPSPPRVHLALLVDQLEEVFTLTELSDRQRGQLCAALHALARCGRVYVLGTLRSDFYHRCSEIPELAGLRSEGGQYDVQAPTAAEIGAMIRQPARLAALMFEHDVASGDGLDDTLLQAASRDGGGLPLLQFALDELYQRREDRTLTLAAYRELGGLEGALAKRAESTFEALDPDVQGAFGRVAKALVGMSVDAGATATRRTAPLRLFPQGTPARALVEALTEARLFATGRTDDGQPVVTIAHEALLLHWPRLADWVVDNQALLRARARFRTAATTWHDAGRRPGFLVTSPRLLAEAVEILQDSDANLAANEREFIQASLAKQKRFRLLKAAVMTVVSGLGVVAAGLAFGFLGEYRRAEYRLYIANVDRAVGQFRHPDVERAGHLLAEAPDQHKAWEWSYLKLRTESSDRAWEGAGPDGVLLSGARWDDDSETIHGWSKHGVQSWTRSTPPEDTTPGGLGTVFSATKALAFHPSGGLVLKHHSDPQLKRGRVLRRDEPGAFLLLGEDQGEVLLAAWNRTGAHLAFSMTQGKGPGRNATYWGVGVVAVSDYAKRVRIPAPHGNEATSLAVDGEGTVLAAGFRSGCVHLWEGLDSGNARSVWQWNCPGKGEAGNRDHRAGGVEVTALDVLQREDGAVALAIGLSNGRIFVGGPDEPKGLPREFAQGPGTRRSVSDLEFAPGGRLLAAGYDDGSVAVLDALSLSRSSDFYGHRSGRTSVSWSPDAERLLSSCSADGDHPVLVWDPLRGGASTLILPRSTGAPTRITHLFVAPDGQHLVAINGDGERWSWDLNSGRYEFGSEPGSPTPVAVAHSAARAGFVAAYVDGSIRSVGDEFERSTTLGTLPDDLSDSIRALAIVDAGRTVLAATLEGSLFSCPADGSGAPLAPLPASRVEALTASVSGVVYAALEIADGADAAHELVTWRDANVMGRASRETLSHPVTLLSADPQGEFLIAGMSGGHVAIRSLTSSAALDFPVGRVDVDRITAFAIAPIGGQDSSESGRPGRLVTASKGDHDGRVAIWDVSRLGSADTSAWPLLEIEFRELNAPTALAFDPKGEWIAVGHESGEVRLLHSLRSEDRKRDYPHDLEIVWRRGP